MGAMRDDDLRHWDSDRIRERHYDDHNYDPDEELDRWLFRGVWVLMFFGAWKMLELGWAIAKWVLA